VALDGIEPTVCGAARHEGAEHRTPTTTAALLQHALTTLFLTQREHNCR
jgi:hypothetical protein